MRLRTRALLTAVVPLLVTACGPSGAVTLTPSDAGTTPTIATGQTVSLTLTDSLGVPGSSTTWTADTSDPTVLSRTTANTMPPPGYSPGMHWTATFTFTAEHPGHADIVATSSATCEAMNPAYCHGPPPMSFHITVTG